MRLTVAVVLACFASTSSASGVVPPSPINAQGVASRTIAAPGYTAAVGLAGQVPVSAFRFLGVGRGYSGCVLPSGLGTATMTSSGAITPATNGTAASAAFDSTTLLGRAPRLQFNSTAAANSLAGITTPRLGWRGDATGKGGFYWWAGWSPVTATAGQRTMVGLSAATLTSAVEPNTVVDAVYVGCNTTDTNLAICSNDNVSTATCSTLGASFPCNTAGALYTAFFWAAPNASTISYAIERLDTPATASGTLSSDLPRTSQILFSQVLMDTGANSGATSMQLTGLCYAATP